jgi:hypothetical protein
VRRVRRAVTSGAAFCAAADAVQWFSFQPDQKPFGLSEQEASGPLHFFAGPAGGWLLPPLPKVGKSQKILRVGISSFRPVSDNDVAPLQAEGGAGGEHMAVVG